MRIRSDDWLAAIIGRPVFAVEASDTPPAEAARTLGDHRRGQSEALYFAKLEADRIALLGALGEAGLSVVDVNVTLEHRGGAPDAPQDAGVEVGDCRQEEASAVLEIAGSCFRYSRFHLDPNIPTAIAHRVKREWIANYLRGRRGERLLVARLEGRPVGFLAVLGAPARRVIDLVGVDREAQGRGIGTALVASFVGLYRSSGDALQVGTQIANTPSLRLYERLGFRVVRSAYVLHGHVGRPLSPSDGVRP